LMSCVRMRAVRRWMLGACWMYGLYSICALGGIWCGEEVGERAGCRSHLSPG
jgi:hypothetical protein